MNAVATIDEYQAEQAEQAAQAIDIDAQRRQAVLGADVTVTELRLAAQAAKLRYPHRAAQPGTTMAEHVQQALATRSWLRQGSPVPLLAEVWLVDANGKTRVLARDERLGTVQRDLTAALHQGSRITHLVVDLADPQVNRTAMLVSFADRASASRAAEAVAALARPAALDLLDETAMLLVAGFGGIDIYPQGTALFVEIADVDQSVVDRDVRTVEDVCFEQGATAVRESAAHHIADADDALATACRPVHQALGYEPVHDGPVPMSELAAFVLRCDEIQRRVGLHLTVFVDGSTGVVTCWPPLGTDARLAELARVALGASR